MEGSISSEGATARQAAGAGWSSPVPTWIRRLGVAVWVRSVDGNITYLNDRAEKLLGVKAEDCVGRLCYEVIRGMDENGEPLCGPSCRVSCLARTGEDLEPVDMRITGQDGSDLHLRVLMIGVSTPGETEPLIVHCALNTEREHGLLGFFERVATRTPHIEPGRLALRSGALTGRELEILSLLAEDMTLHSVANRLNISYTTVRNHVQHVLGKLGVHSIIEAVACYLLSDEMFKEE